MRLPSLRHNIAALGGVQVANYLIPLLTVPYLTRVLGAEGWGRMAFALFVLQYFVLLTDYGFTWSAVRQISAERDNRDAVTSIFSATWGAQLALGAASAVLLAALVTAVPMLRNDWPLYLAGYAVVLGNVLFPVWLMQGLERVREMAVIQVAVKLALLLPLFIFVQGPGDTALAMAIQASAGALGGIACFYWIVTRKVVGWRTPTGAEILRALRSGGALFLSRVWISLYTSTVPILLGAFAGPVAVAHYSLADRIRLAASFLLSPISNALFPRMTHLYAHDRAEAARLLVKLIRTVSVVAGLASVALWVSAKALVLVMGGSQFEEAASILRLLAPLPFLVALSNVFGVQVMIPNGMTRPFNGTLFAGGVVALISIVPLACSYGAQGAAVATLLAELTVTIAMALVLTRQGLLHAPWPVRPR